MTFGWLGLSKNAVRLFPAGDVDLLPALRRVYVSGDMVDRHVDGDFQRAT
jgi:hypothetical protein